MKALFVMAVALGMSVVANASSIDGVQVFAAKDSARIETAGRMPLGGVCFCGTYSANNRQACRDYVANLGISSTNDITLTGSCAEQMNDFSKCNGAYCSLFQGFAVLTPAN